MLTVILVFLICLAASTIGGVCGIGGGVVIKPVLDASGIMSVSTVSFLSGLTVLAMSCVNVWKSRKSHELDIRSLHLGIGAAVGGVLGKELFSLVKKWANADALVGAVQAVVLGICVLGTLLYVLKVLDALSMVVRKKRIVSRNVRSVPLTVTIGLGLGIMSSFLGIGGGPMNLVVLYYFFSMDTKKASVNSILVILLSQSASLGMTLATGSVPEFRWEILAAMAGAGILGGFLSAGLHKKLSAAVTDKLFAGLMVVILGICMYNAVRMFAAV